MADRNFKPDSGTDLVFEDAGSTDRLRITDGGSTILYEDGGAAALTIDTDGDVNLTQDIYLASGKGIYFDGGTTSANYLGGSDAYEEGPWDPTITAQEGSGATFTKTNLNYTKIGRFVVCSGKIQVSGSVGTSGGGIYLTLPFTASNNDSAGSGFEMAIVGYSCGVYGETPNSIRIVKYDSTTAITANHAIRFSYSFYTS